MDAMDGSIGRRKLEDSSMVWCERDAEERFSGWDETLILKYRKTAKGTRKGRIA